MKKYKFCLKGKTEAIAQVSTESLKDAVEYFAKLKNLKTEDFLSIYDVIEVPESQEKTYY